MCVIGCEPFRVGNNYFKNIDTDKDKNGIVISVINIPTDILHNKERLLKYVDEKILLDEPNNYIYQGSQIQYSKNEFNSYIPLLRTELGKKRITRVLTKKVIDEFKFQLIIIYSKKDNIKSYLRGSDKWNIIPQWFIKNKVCDFNPKSFDDTLEIIEAKSLEDVKQIKRAVNNKTSCIFCDESLYQEAKRHYKPIFPEYTWCVDNNSLLS